MKKLVVTLITIVAFWAMIPFPASAATATERAMGSLPSVTKLQSVMENSISARLLKVNAIQKLENAKAGQRYVDAGIDEAIYWIEQSLVDILWVGETHVDSEWGSIVFEEERAAVVHARVNIEEFNGQMPLLEKLIAWKQARGLDTTEETAKLLAMQKAVPVLEEVINDLVKADESLALIAVEDAKNITLDDPSKQRMANFLIAQAKKQIAKGCDEISNGRPAKAISRFELAWRCAERTIGFAFPGRTVKVGCVLSTSGPLGPMGGRMMNAAELATEQINENGGIFGRRVELLQEDDNTNPATCLEKVTQLVEEDGVEVLLGGMTSPAAMATGPYVADHEVLMISPSSTLAYISDQDWTGWFFRTCPDDTLQGKALAQIIMEGDAEGNNYTRLATMVMDNDYGKDLEEALVNWLSELGWPGEHVVSIHFDPTAPNYTSELVRIAAANPGIVLAVTYTDDGIKIFKQALEMGLDTIDWLGCDGNYGSGMFADEAAAEFMENAIVAGTRPAGLGEASEEFAEAYTARFGEEPEVYCDTTYDAIKLIAQAIEQAGAYDGAAIRDALLEVGQNYDGASGTITFNDKGDRVIGTYEIWDVEKDVEGVYHNVAIDYITVSY